MRRFWPHLFCHFLFLSYALCETLEPLQIVVGFKANTTSEQKDILHKKVGSVLKDRIKDLSFDLISIPTSGKDRTNKRICAIYKKSPIVISCETNKRSMQRQQPNKNNPCSKDGPITKATSIGLNCELAPAKKIGDGNRGIFSQFKLHESWSQEIPGADLASSFLKEVKDKQKVPVAILQSAFLPSPKAETTESFRAALREINPTSTTDGHGQKMMNLMGDKEDVSAVPRGTMVWSDIGAGARDFDVARSLVRMANGESKVLGIPASLPGYSSQMAADFYIKRNKIIVQAAGNNYPERDASSHNQKIIRIGSMGPDGAISTFTQDKIHALVPCDRFQSAGDGELSGWTSGCSGLATGAVINVSSLLPQISSDEMIALIKKTSVPTLYQSAGGGEGYGTGMLNIYKLTRVAHCLRSNNFDQNRKALLALNPQPDCFDFKAEAEQEYAQAMSAIENKDCAEKKKGFEKLRKSFLLHPNKATAEQLAKIYSNPLYSRASALSTFYSSFFLNKGEQADFFKKLLEEGSQKITYFSDSPIETKAGSAFSFASRLPDGHHLKDMAIQKIKLHLASKDLNQQRQGAIWAAMLGPSGHSFLLQALNGKSTAMQSIAAQLFKTMVIGEDNQWKDETIKYLEGQQALTKVEALTGQIAQR